MRLSQVPGRLLRGAVLGRFAAKTAAASALPHLFRSRNSVGLPSSYPPPGPQSFAVGICGVGTRLAVTTAQSGVAVNGSAHTRISKPHTNTKTQKEKYDTFGSRTRAQLLFTSYRPIALPAELSGSNNRAQLQTGIHTTLLW